MKRFIIPLLICLLLLLTACEDTVVKPKDNVANQLTREIANCNHKFESDSKSYDYCEMVLKLTKELIDDGFFNDEDEMNTFITKIEKNTSINDDDLQTEYDTFKDSILGDI